MRLCGLDTAPPRQNQTPAEFSESGTESSGFMKAGNLVEQLRNYKLFEKDPTPWNLSLSIAEHATSDPLHRNLLYAL
jgi:hypothetical protein